MLSYILRRLLLMIPTLIGISFLVFMLVALSPGGVAAALMATQGGGSGSGGGEAGERAAVEAYLEERYGLNDPVIVQYLRWLARVSPIKFGVRDQIDPNGTVIRPPKPIEPPPLAGEWYAIGRPLPDAPEPVTATFESTDVLLPPEFVDAGRMTLSSWIPPRRDVVIKDQPLARLTNADGADETVLFSPARGILRPIVEAGDRITDPGTPIAELRPDRPGIYRRAEAEYARAKREFTQARVALEQALVAYAHTAGLPDAIGKKDRPRLSVFRRAGFDPAVPEYQSVRDAGVLALAKYEAALIERAKLIGVFNATPFRESGIWLGNIVGLDLPDLGFSFTRSQPSTQLIRTALPVTLTLNFIAVPIIYFIAIPSGILAATRRGTWIDIGSGALFVALWSIPIVWAGVLAVGYLGSEKYFLGEYAFPSKGLHALDADSYAFLPGIREGVWHRGYLLDMLWHLCLPVACLVYGGFAVLSKQTRAAMLDNFNADYVRTAKAKGVSGPAIVFRHVFRNSLLPLITMFATVFPLLLSGSVVIEKIFSIQGMGMLLYESIILRDRELLLAIVMIVALINMLALLLADILYALADPRIAYD